MSGAPFLSENFVLLSGLILTLCPAMLFGRFRKKDAVPVPEKIVLYPSAGRPVPRSSSEGRDAVMAVVRQLEAYLDRINAGGVGEDERKWQNKLRAELEGIKKSVDAGDFSAARRRLSSAEMYVKMLELHMAGR
jgi:hypothetical protein